MALHNTESTPQRIRKTLPLHPTILVLFFPFPSPILHPAHLQQLLTFHEVGHVAWREGATGHATQQVGAQAVKSAMAACHSLPSISPHPHDHSPSVFPPPCWPLPAIHLPSPTPLTLCVCPPAPVAGARSLHSPPRNQRQASVDVALHSRQLQIWQLLDEAKHHGHHKPTGCGKQRQCKLPAVRFNNHRLWAPPKALAVLAPGRQMRTVLNRVKRQHNVPKKKLATRFRPPSTPPVRPCLHDRLHQRLVPEERLVRPACSSLACM